MTATGVSLMVDEMRRLATDVVKAAGRLASLEDVDAVMKKGSTVIKDGQNANLAGSGSFQGIAGSVTYDRTAALGGVAYEGGPDKARHGGALANIAFFGGSRGGGTVDFDGPLDAEIPAIEEKLADLIEGLL